MTLSPYSQKLGAGRLLCARLKFRRIEMRGIGLLHPFFPAIAKSQIWGFLVMPPIIKINYPRLVQDAIKVTYSDPLTGNSPDIELTVFDRGILPVAIRSQLELEIGRSESPYRLRAGIFEVDRIMTSDRMRTIAATGLPLSDPQLKTLRDEDFAEFMLIDILQFFADRYSLTVFTRDLPEIEFSNLAQTKQSDLEFLNSLANRIGAVFKIENRQLIFTLLIDLEKRLPLFSLETSEIIKFSETILGTEIYQYIDYEVVLFGDTEYIRVEDDRVSNGKVTEYRGAGVGADDENLLIISAREKLRQINGANHLFEIEVMGDSRLIAGSTFTINKKLAFCDRAVHTIDASKGIWVAALSCRYLPRDG